MSLQFSSATSSTAQPRTTKFNNIVDRIRQSTQPSTSAGTDAAAGKVPSDTVSLSSAAKGTGASAKSDASPKTHFNDIVARIRGNEPAAATAATAGTAAPAAASGASTTASTAAASTATATATATTTTSPRDTTGAVDRARAHSGVKSYEAAMKEDQDKLAAAKVAASPAAAGATSSTAAAGATSATATTAGTSSTPAASAAATPAPTTHQDTTGAVERARSRSGVKSYEVAMKEDKDRQAAAAAAASKSSSESPAPAPAPEATPS